MASEHTVNPVETTLLTLNDSFIEAFRLGSWELLKPILAPDFRYLDGVTGEVWTMGRYIDNLRSHSVPTLEIDQVAVHVTGSTAVVSARTTADAGKYSRYVDTYERRAGAWTCVHACVWPLPSQYARQPGQPSRFW
jgi:Domain of unknown function (DUF4440)